MNTHHPTGLPSRALRPGLALLLGAAAALACEREDAMTGPQAISPAHRARDVITTEAAPVEGTFTLRVAYPSNPSGGLCPFAGTEVMASGDPPTYTLPSEEGTFCIAVRLFPPIVTKEGVFVRSRCMSRETGFNTSSTACTEPGGGGRWIREGSRMSILNGTLIFTFALDPEATYGFRLEYRGRGNGVKNTTLPPFDVTRPAA